MLDILNRNRIAELEKELATYKHAYETTRDDRDRWKAEHERQQTALQWALDNPALLAEPPLPAMTGAYPRLVCVGAQKCATSFLYSAIREHHAVEVSPKDTEAPFGSAPIAFEAGLIDRPNSIAQIAALNSDARILICTRDPIDRAISEYKMRVRAGRETRTFQEAIAADEQTGPFAYLRRSRYAEDITRFREAFEHILVLSADDDTHSNLWRLFCFMGLRDADALVISGSPPMRYAESSSAAEQIKGKPLPPELQRHHDFEPSPEERKKLFEAHFAEDQRKLRALMAAPSP